MKNVKIVYWNVNGLRAVWRKNFLEFVEKYQPDILCLQEIKALPEQLPAELLDLPGYQVYFNSAERKGYSGTAIYSKYKAKTVDKGLETVVDLEGRVLSLEFDDFYLVNVYTPNSKNDLSRLSYRYEIWDPAFLKHLKKLEQTKPVVFGGDLNAAHQDIDLARPKANKGKHGFTAEEREGVSNLIKAGFVDTFRHFHPQKTEAYTWWTHWAQARARNVGWRIDYVGVSASLIDQVKDAFIWSEVEGSDHCPVGIILG